MKSYRVAFDDAIDMMIQNNEIPWDFSTSYVFGLTQMLTDRLNKVKYRIIYLSLFLITFL